MKTPRIPLAKAVVSTVGVAALALPLAACTSIGSSSDAGGKVGITLLMPNVGEAVANAKAMATAFEKANPDIKVTINTQTEGDALIKTKLSTGTMEDVFYDNSGSVFQALNPDKTLVALNDQPWVADISDTMKSVVSTPSGIYGAPWGSSLAGGVLYNKKVYKDLGLTVPTSWSEFAANNEKIKAAGKVPVIQTYGDAFTSQMFVLGDFGNVQAQDPSWATEYTAAKRKYVDQPAIQGFKNLQQGLSSGWWNKNYASAKLDDGVRMLATGEGAQYPWLTDAISSVKQNYPKNLNDIGVFPLPAQNAADTRLTVWLPSAVYIPQTTTGDKLVAAKKFVAFVNSPDGCKVQSSTGTPGGPYVSKCTLGNDVPALVKDMQPYFDQKKTVPALEFLSAVKGPNLDKISVEVGSGIRTAAQGAQEYDQDVQRQAQQLGLKGW